MKTCSLCKSRVDEEEGRITDAGKFVCIDCANDVEEDSAYCDECGEPLEKGKCPACSGDDADAEETEEEEEEAEEDA